MKNGSVVREFEKAFADYVGAKYAIALCNGTATLHTALAALGVKPGDKVAVPPLTMSATTIAVLQAGAVPEFVDVDEHCWLMRPDLARAPWALPVSLYGLDALGFAGPMVLNDAAQTLAKHRDVGFTSYSFQASKILALGEGGMLVTDSEELATKAREFSSLGYRMKADQPRIDPSVLKAPDYQRHHSLGWNYRMNDSTASRGIRKLGIAHVLKQKRQVAAPLYREAIEGCSWITPQYVPEGWTHDYWCYTIALESKELWKPFTEAVVRHGGEMPYGAWRLTYQEPAFRYLNPQRVLDVSDVSGPKTLLVDQPLCPIAEDLHRRLVQFQTNNLESAERNAKAVKKAIEEISQKRNWQHIWNYGTILNNAPIGRKSNATGTPCS